MSTFRKKIITVLAVLFCALLALSTVSIIPKNENKVAEAANLNSAISGNFTVLNDDIWISNTTNGGKFDYNNLKTLFGKLTGQTTATYNDVVRLGVKDSSYFRGLSTSGGKNLSIKFHGFHWTVVNLNRTRSGDVILTLWLTDYSELPSGYQSTQYATYHDSGTGTDVWTPNIYVTSVLRTKLNIDGYYFSNMNKGNPTHVSQIASHPLAAFTMDGVADSVTKYIAKPSEVSYQQNEITSDWGGTMMFPNEGYGPYTSTELATWNSDAGYRAYGEYDDLRYNGVTYNSWQEDPIWVPSCSEVGYVRGNGGIWGLDIEAKTSGYSTTAAHSWTRTGGTTTSNARLVLGYEDNLGGDYNYRGDTTGTAADTTAKIRPALHLNLTKVMTLDADDMTTEYNGSEQRIEGTSGLAASNAAAALWYDSNVYTSTYMDFDYELNSDASVTSPLNAGEYKVTIKFTTAAQDMGFKWKNPLSSNPNNKEIKLTIKKKPLKITFEKKGGGTFNPATVTSGDENNYPVAVFQAADKAGIYANDKPEDTNPLFPKLKTKYTSNTGASYNIPTALGSYRATAEMANDCNYCVAEDNSSSGYHDYKDFTVEAYKVTVPVLNVATGETATSINDFVYDANAHSVTLPIFGVALTKTFGTIQTYSDLVTITYTSADTFSYDDNTHTATATKAATYTLTATLADPATMEWADNSGSNPKPLTFKIKKAPLEITFADGDPDDGVDFDSGSWGRNVATNILFTVNVTGEINSEQVELKVYHTKSDGTGETVLTAQSGRSYSIAGNLDVANGYMLYAELTNDTVNDNYEIIVNGNPAAKAVKSFNVIVTDAPFTPNDLKWVYTNVDIANNVPQAFNTDHKVTYNGKTYYVSLDTSNLASKGVTVDTEFAGFTSGFDGVMSAMNASSTAYVISVRLKPLSADYNFTADTYTFEWYIDKADFDLSSYTIKWKYNARGVDKDFPVDGDAVKYEAPYEGGQGAGGTTGQIKVFLSGLPTGLTAVYSEQGYNCTGYDIGGYTAKVIKLESTNPNYNDIDDLSSYNWATREWKIVKHILPTESGLWSQAQYSDEHVTAAPELDTMPYGVPLAYKYYDSYDNALNDVDDIAFADLTYTDGTEKIYYVKAFIKNPDDMDKWGLDGTSPESNNPHRFVVGANRIAVEIEVSGGGMYDGTPQSAKIELVGTYSDIDLDAFSITYYNSDGGVLTGAPTDVGTYKVKIALKGDYADSHFIKNNKEYELVITTRILEEPKYEGALTYNGEEQDIAKLVGLPDGWENYLEITINGNSGSKVRDVGTYTILFKIKESDIAAGNVAWKTADTAQKTSPRTLKLNVNQLVLHAKKWSKNGYYTALEFEEENGNKFVTYTVKDANGNLVTESEFYAHPDDEYIVEVAIGEEHGNNVRIEYAGGVNPQLRFIGNSTDEGDAAELEEKKNSAKEELEKEAKAKKDAVDADVNLTPEEKKAAKDEIEKELEEGKAEIDKATDKDGVDKALGEGKKEIDDTADLAQGKGAAKSELDKAAQAKKDAIDADPDLTDEEKAAAKAEVDKELEEGKKAIDGATDLSGVQSLESTTKTNIENIKPEHKGGSFPWWILAVIAGAIVLLTVIVIVVVKRRNSEDDDGGYDDFYDDEYDYDEEEVDDDGDEEAYGF